MSPAGTQQRSGAIRCRPSDTLGLLPLLALSIALHVIAALGLAFVLSRHFQDKPPIEPPDLEMDVMLGEAVQAPIATPPEASPSPAREPPEPAPSPPSPEVMPAPPPVVQKEVNFPELKTTPPPQPKSPPKRAEPRTPPNKAAAASTAGHPGSTPRRGVAGGTSAPGKPAGTPGAPKVGAYRTPRPSYPMAARASHIQGSGEMKVIFDAAGNVREVVITRPIAPILDANTRTFVKQNWKGPPNSSLTKPVIYRLE